MSGRGRQRVRGRPPKTPSGGRGSGNAKKPRYLYAGGHANTVQYRQRLREGLRQEQFIGDSASESENNAAVTSDNELDDLGIIEARVGSENGDGRAGDEDSWNSSEHEEHDSDEDYVEGIEKSERTTGGTEERRRLPRRPTTPVFLQDREKPTLQLPPSSDDLLMPREHLMRALDVYETMRHFSNVLRMTPFTFEEFCAALMSPDHSALLSECHMCLLKAILREADAVNTHFGPQDIKDSINIHLYVLDHVTWPSTLQMYLLADAEHRPALLSFLGLSPDHEAVPSSHEPCYQSEYPLNAGVSRRLSVLQFLAGQFLDITPVRDDTTREGAPQHDDHCRVCHKLGDLLCCEQCPAVYHLTCLDPPLETVPSEDWVCPVCRGNAVKGVADCVSEIERAGLLARQDVLGYDREGRKYWFLVRRIIAEGDTDGEEHSEVFYYSSVAQLEELMSCLDGDDLEADLVRVLNEQRLDVERQMNLTMELTTAANKTGRKSWLEDNRIEVEARLKLKQEQMLDQVAGSLTATVKSESAEVQTRSKTAALNQTSFRLGSEANFRNYSNSFSSNTLALNRHQHAEERDKKRHLSHKFSLTPASEFKWISTSSGSQSNSVTDLPSVLNLLRQTMLHLESQLGGCLLHPQWTAHFRSQWVQALNKCNKTKDMVTALQVLESVMKPCVFVPAWSESLGHTFLRRSTQNEREEKKKQDKKERRGIAGFMALYSGVTEDGEDVSDRSLWCKYTLGLRHQVWKQKGEEFRITGTGGWCWNARTRVSRPKPMSECGLRAGPTRLSIFLSGQTVPRIVDVSKLEVSVTQKDNTAELKRPALIRALCDQHKVTIEDVLDVSSALMDQTRSLYPKVAATAKLDKLLERRVRLSKLQGGGNTGVISEEAPLILPPGLSCYACTESTRSSCYSPLCRMFTAQVHASRRLTDTREKVDLTKLRQYSGGSTVVSGGAADTANLPVAKVQQLPRKPRKKELPPIHKFVTGNGGRKSLLVLDKWDYRKLARRSGLGEAQGFSYSAKSNSQVWNYGSAPRPVLRTLWRWRNTQFLWTSSACVALQLRVLWHCLRWDDLVTKPPPSGSNTVTTDTQVETSELVRRRDLPPYGLRSEYLVRKIIVPIDLPSKPREKTAPQRSGLRERRRPESPQSRGPQMTEVWTSEELLEVWELKIFQEKLEKQIKERQQEKALAPSLSDKAHSATRITSSASSTLSGSTNIVGVKVVGAGKSPAEIRAQMEANLRAQRLALQGKKVVTVASSGGTVLQTTVGDVGVRRIAPAVSSATGGSVTQSIGTTTKQIVIRPAGATIVSSKGAAGATSIRSGSPAVIRAGVRPTLTQAGQQARPTVRPAGSSQVKSQVHIIQGPNGQLTVRGLQPGQQLLKLPDGRLQIVNIQQKPASPQASSVGQTSSVQKIVIQPSSASQTGTSGIAASAAAAAGQKLIQIRSSGVATPQNVSNTVKAVKLIQSSGGTQVVQTGVGGQLIKGHLVQQVGTLVQPLTTPVVLSTNSLALSGSTTAAATTLLQPVATGSPKVVISASQLGSTGPQLILTNPTTATTMTATQTGRQEVVKQEPPSSPQMTSVGGAAAPTTGNTGTPHKIILTSQQFAPKVALSVASGGSTPARMTGTGIVKSPPSPPAASSATFVLTPAMTQQIVKQALMNPSTTPEVQQKLLALQRHHATVTTPTSGQNSTQQASTGQHQTVAPKVKSEPGTGSQNSQSSIGTSNAISGILATTPKKEPLANDENIHCEPTGTADQHQPASLQVLRNTITQVERDERNNQRRQRARDSEMEKRLRAQQALLAKQTEALRREIMRKRALMERELALKIEEDLQIDRQLQENRKRQNQALSAPPSNVVVSASVTPSTVTKPKNTVSNQVNVNNQNGASGGPMGGTKGGSRSPPKSSQSAAQKSQPSTNSNNNRKRTASNSVVNTAGGQASEGASSPKKKARSSSFTSGGTGAASGTHGGPGGSASASKVYCICKKPYDPSKFMIGCDLCSNWFHTTCIGVTEAQARAMDSWVCSDCQQQQDDADVELYCLCQTPYDESQFYICCDNCQGWFHGGCVGVLASEASKIDVYICPQCKASSGEEVSVAVLNRSLGKTDQENLRKLLFAVRAHKQAWPFKEPVNRRQAPDYYQVIKEPMDLRTMEQKLNVGKYNTLAPFVADMTKIFDNCRYYNQKNSAFYVCADLLEAFFGQKIKLFKEALQRRM
ncbi:nucleosome-remodeling factor subunit NURF301-like isoform X2 [Varroa jacobsoni]|uniref:nucleosome-remodeling factor subunit NURF301-like isoform X2 n=1 Tax=Varroa jacobsoni TaxID=62625 RepID=UPI000BF2C1F8|nr:nucleosome-remodeling factor subunit NURF301-like isoform X2 [Varroa jacobsoni]